MSGAVGPREMAWWGWGDPGRERALPPGAGELLRAELGVEGPPRPPVAAEEVRMPPPALAPAALEGLRAIVGPEHAGQDRHARLVHAAGKSYLDLVRQRAGDASEAPDAVVAPGDHDQVAAVLARCTANDVAVVPFGGGTSVVGGVAPQRGDHSAVISLDLRRLGRVVGLDERSLTVVAQGGLRLVDAEAALEARGLTLGHFPQSYEHVSIGGCLATRSAGQSSTGYGRFDDLAVGLRCAAPAGTLELPARPASAAGPDLRELVMGSEGALGVITEAALRVHPRPAARRYEGWFVHDFAEGVEALRALAQHGPRPDVARLSDAEETRLSTALAGGGQGAHRLAGTYLRARGYAGGCLAIVGFEGEPDDVALRRTGAARVLRRHGATYVGRRVGEGWSRGRFGAPYLRDALLDHGVLVETLETAAQWSALTGLHAAVGAALRDALAARGTPALVGCHVSHLYPTGASLYFTVLARQERGAEAAQWEAAKRAASEAIVGARATITHHHAVGRDHAPWLGAEIGEAGLGLLRAAKARLDPGWILNPGKLVP